MVDPRARARADQAFEQIHEDLPPQLWRFFVALMKEGFPEDCALALTQTFLAELLRDAPGPG